MPAFCTISTASHLFKTFALANSLSRFNMHLHVLVTDADPAVTAPQNVIIYPITTVTSDIGLKLISRYQQQPDKLRWALKSVFMSQLLATHSKVIYVDNDIFFYSDPTFLFEQLSNSSIILTPHFYDANPAQNQNWLEANFKVGLYNAGFVGANTNGSAALNWWAQCCLYNIKKRYWRGLFDDQKYLDLFPVLFDDVHVVKHRGCNLAGWNYLWYNLKRNNAGELLINTTDRLVFIHFAETSMLHFHKPGSPLFAEYKTYLANLHQYNPGFVFKRSYFNTYSISVYFNYLKWKLCRLIER